MKTKSVPLSSRAAVKKPQTSPVKIHLSRSDKRFYGIFIAAMCVITLLYWYVGGKNPFIIPTMLCIVLVLRNNHRKRTSRSDR